MYKVNSVFYSLQGEGAQMGTPAVFCRFSKCNLTCHFCDTDFHSYNTYTPEDLAQRIKDLWPRQYNGRVIFTGGEPTLSLLKERDPLPHLLSGWHYSIETNGILPVPAWIDWVCVSPKTTKFVVKRGQELKVIWPTKLNLAELFMRTNFDHYYIQPQDGPDKLRYTQEAIQYCLDNPQWLLSIQVHKLIGVP